MKHKAIKKISYTIELFKNRLTAIAVVFIVALEVGLFTTNISIAQTTDAINLSNYKFFTSKDGLYSEKINSILQDSLGFLWLGTSDGLYQYDGSVFKKFEQDKSLNSLLNSSVVCLFKDSKGNIWVGTSTGVLHYNWHTGKFSKIELSKEAYVTSFAEDSKHSIWISTHSGIFLIDEKLTSTNYSLIQTHCQAVLTNNHFPNKIFVLAANKLLVVNTASNTLVKELVYSTGNENTTDYAQLDATNVLWVGRFNGEVFKINPTSFELETFDLKKEFKNPSARVTSIFCNSKNKVWFSVDEIGFVYYDYSKKQLARFETLKENHLPSYKATALYIDRENNYWLGLDKFGLAKTNLFQNTFSQLNSEVFEKNKIVSALLRDSEGNLWVGTDGGGIFVFDRDLKLVKKFRNNPGNNSSIGNDAIQAIYEDSNKQLWIGSFKGGLSLYQKQTNSFVNFQTTKNDSTWILKNDVRKIQEDSNHNLWLVVQGKGVTCFNPQTKVFKNYANLSASGLWTNDLLITKSGDIWVTSSNGLFRKKKNEASFIQLDKEKISLQETYSTCIYEDYSAKIWIGTLHGLYTFNSTTNEFVKVSGSTLLSNSAIRSINQDESGQFIIGTNRGLFRYESSDGFIEYFGEEDGLIDQNFIINSSFKEKGVMYLGTSKGLCWFPMASLGKGNATGSFYLTDIKVNNSSIQFESNYSISNSIPTLKNLELDYNENYITFDFALPSYSNNISRIPYEYRLEGFDEKWQAGNEKKSITFTSIPPGEYVLHIRKVNSKNTENNLRLAITIHPPFYKTWWFRVLLVILIFILIAIYLNWKTWQLSERNRILENKIQERTSEIKDQNKLLEKQRQDLQAANETKDKLFSIIAHDLRNPFTTILSMSDYLNSHVSTNGNEKIREVSNGIYKASKNAYQLLENLLQWAKFQTGRISMHPEWLNVDLSIQSIIDSLSLQSLEKNVEIKLTNTSNCHAFIDKIMFETIVRNLSNNALKFSYPSSTISITCSSSTSGFEFTIMDTGVGMDNLTIDKIRNENVANSTNGTNGEIGTGIGLMVVKEFIENQHSKWNIVSEKGKGTTIQVVFSVPIRIVSTTQTEKITSSSEPLTPINSLKLDEKTIDFLKDKLVLIVDDQEDIRKSIELHIGEKVVLQQATNGREGLQLAKENLPDIIISDVMMPEMNGIEFAKKIKDELHTSHIPVILLTSQKEEHDVVQGLEAGVDDYLLKPFNATILLLKITNLLRNREKIKKKYGLNEEELLDSSNENSADKLFIEKVQTCIQQNISNEEFSVEVVCLDLGLNRNVLTKKITLLSGMSPNELIIMMRMKAAAKLLLTSNLNISEIAYDVGYSDPKYFSKSFKKYFGVLPTEYHKTTQK